jgi:hypothetical protein
MSATIQDLVNASKALQGSTTHEEIENAKDAFLALMDEVDIHAHMLLSVDMVAALRIRDYDHFRSFVLALAHAMINEMASLPDEPDSDEIAIQTFEL